MDTQNKIKTLSQAQSQRELWREEGLKVGFTNGCFDLLHPGHVSYLEASKTLVDVLIVGLNSDSSVRELKGAERPVQEGQGRARVLAGLAAVDMVVEFEELTPLNLITALQPDVLTKGADYSLDQVVGASYVLAHGGSVELIPLVAGHSTTALIAKNDGKK